MHTLQNSNIYIDLQLVKYPSPCGEKEIFDMAVMMRRGLQQSNNMQTSSSESQATIDNSSFIRIKNIFDILKPIQNNEACKPEVIMIEGAPGMGKTTLCKEIAYQWATNQSLAFLKLVLLIPVQNNITVDKIKSLEDFILSFYNFDETAADFAKQCAGILQKQNHDILVILDGYQDSTENIFLTQIISQKVLRQSRMIITPQNVSTSKLQAIADLRIEILGLSDEDKKKYIENEFQNYPNKIEVLSSYLSANKNINGICYVPMIMGMVVQTYKESEQLPENQTEFYQKIISLIITTHVQKYHESEGLQSATLLLQDLPEMFQSHLIDLSKVAFDCLKSGKSVFTNAQLSMVNSETSLNHCLQGLGLLKSTQCLCRENTKLSTFHIFLHISIQEFLAAYYIFSLKILNQFELLRNTFFNHEYINVWIMFVDLSKHAFLDILNYATYCTARHISESLLSNMNDHDVLQTFSDFINHCISSTHPEPVQLFGLKTAETKYYNTLCLNNTVDELSLMNKFTLTKIVWNKVYLSLHHNSEVDKDLIEMFLVDQNIQENVYSRLAVELNRNKNFSVMIINAASLLGFRASKQQLSSGLNMNDTITNLVIRDCCISDETSAMMSSYIENSKLHVVVFDECTFNGGSGKIIFNAMGHIKTVEILVIGNTDFGEDMATAVANTIVSNSKLSYLEIVNCNLQKDVAFKIITALKNVVNLGTLILNNSGSLKEVSDDLAAVICINCNLKKLKLANSNLQHHATVVAQALSQVKTLTELDLSNNNMTEKVVDSLALAIESNASLRRVNLRGNALKASGMIKIAQSLSWGSNLRILDICNNQITTEAADAIAIAILGNMNLEELYLDNNRLGTGVRVIATALKEISTLTVLSLDSNNATEIASNELAAVVQNNKLENLSLANNDLQLGVIKIAQALSQISTLTTLNLHENGMTKDVACSLAAALKSNHSMTTLKLSCNKLETDGFKIISQSLRELKLLQVLYINSNQITEQAAEDIASVILSNSELKELYLSNNDLQDGLITIAESLQSTSKLEKLILNDNNMSENVADALAVALKKLTSLKSLAVMNNKLRSKGIMSIVKSLNHISGLTLLNIYNNQITEEVEDGIASAIQNNSKLEEIYLGENDLPRAGKIVVALKDAHVLREINLNGCSMLESVTEELEIGLANKNLLKVVGLEGNYLKSSGIIKISMSLKNISNLTLLNLFNNRITEEAGEALASIILSNTKLEDLYLGSNMLQTGALKVLLALKHISTLKVLDLNDNNVTDYVADELAAVIDCNFLLKDLRLRSNRLKTKGFITIAKSLSKLTTLKSLNVRNNEITKEAVDDIVSVLSSNTNVTHLYFGTNNLQDGAVKIVAALNNSTINVLDLDNNNIPGRITSQLLADILCSCRSIKSVWFRRNDLYLLGESFPEQLTEVFCNTITTLDLSDNYMNDAVADQVSVIIANNNSLEELHLRNNNIQSRGSVKIVNALGTLKKFKSLNLGGNLITEDASDSIASMILNSPELKELYLGNNYLAGGILKIAEALKKVSKLKILHFDNNGINAFDAEKLALLFNDTIEELNLSYNNLQSSSEYLFKSLCKISSLKSLSLTGCCMTDAVTKYLAVVIEGNNSLRTLKVQNNYFNTNGLITIAKALTKLSTLRSLNVRNNVVRTKEAAEAISLVLLKNITMEHFYYGESIIQNHAAEVVANLKAISTLVTLYLTNIKLTEENVDDLVAVIENNILLEDICLAGNNLLSAGLTKVLNACKISTKNLISLDVQCNLVDSNELACISFDTSNFQFLEAFLLGGITLNTVEKIFYEVFLYFMQLYDQLHMTDSYCKSGMKPVGHDKRKNFVSNRTKLLEVFSLQMQSHNMSLMSKWNYNSTTTFTMNYNDHVFTNVIDENFLNQNMLKVVDNISLKLSHVNATSLFCFPLIKSLKVIDLGLSNIDEGAAFELAAMLHYNSVLTQLWLRGNKLNAAGALFILNSLEYVSTLKVLDLSYNNITCQVANNLAATISSNYALEQLWLDGNNLLSTGVARISASIKSLSTLRILSLCNNKITHEASNDLAIAINSCPRLEDLLLGSNNFQGAGICCIAQSFNKHLRLRKLDLFNNKITKDAADRLAAAISNCHSLQELYLSDNMLESIGATRILQALKFKCKLQILTLSNNNITDVIVSDLTDVLVNNNTFYVLLIGRNDLKTAGALKIAEVVKMYNTGMQLLDLCDNNVSAQGKDDIDMILSTVKQLKFFI